MPEQTKLVLADVILRRLNGGDYADDSKYNLLDACLVLDEVRDGFIAKSLNTIKRSRRSVDASMRGDFVSQVIKAVATEAETTRKYCLVPEGVITLDRDMGYFGAFYGTNFATPIIPVRNSGGLYDGLMAGDLEGRIGYYPELTATNERRLYFSGNTTGLSGNVMLKLILKSSSIENHHPYPIPSEFLSEIIDTVVQKMANSPQEDRVADGVDDKI